MTLTQPLIIFGLRVMDIRRQLQLQQQQQYQQQQQQQQLQQH